MCKGSEKAEGRVDAESALETAEGAEQPGPSDVSDESLSPILEQVGGGGALCLRRFGS